MPQRKNRSVVTGSLKTPSAHEHTVKSTRIAAAEVVAGNPLIKGTYRDKQSPAKSNASSRVALASEPRTALMGRTPLSPGGLTG
jgi:hypothetical protein